VNKTSIEWTHRPGTVGMTWNPIHFRRTDGSTIQRTSSKGRVYPVTGNMCTRISPGCTHCYASTLNERQGNQLAYTVENLSKGEFYLDEKELQAPLRTKKPCTIFVGDMFDLFHEAIPDEMIDRVMAVALHCAEPWYRCFGRECDHCPCNENVCREIQPNTFQFLTKRADRLHEYMSHPDRKYRVCLAWNALGWYYENSPVEEHSWPPKTSWFGVSVEAQKYADERIPLLLQTPAAVRFLSVEPQLEAVDLDNLHPPNFGSAFRHTFGWPAIDWVICGGESGPKARPFNLAWAESLREQCKAAGVAFFMKQVGSRPQVHSCRNEACTHPDCGMEAIKQKDRKGGDPSEWPESLRVREFPG